MKERTLLEDKAVRFHYNWNQFDKAMQNYTDYVGRANTARTMLQRTSQESSQTQKLRQAIEENEQTAQDFLSAAVAAYQTLEATFQLVAKKKTRVARK